MTKRTRHNPVAKHAHKFNKSAVHRDRTKYTRKEKHPVDENRSQRHNVTDNQGDTPNA